MDMSTASKNMKILTYLQTNPYEILLYLFYSYSYIYNILFIYYI